MLKIFQIRSGGSTPLAKLIMAVILAGAAAQTARATPSGHPDCASVITANFRPDSDTKILRIIQFRKDNTLPNPVNGGLFDPSTTALADLCLVKLLVGPGNPGPADAPSTSAGVGIEIWLPARSAWNGRIHAIGGGGWVGGEEQRLDMISSTAAAGDSRAAHRVAAEEGAVTSTTDSGHSGVRYGGAFLMNPDGTVNRTLWRDMAKRSIHLQIVLTKAVTRAYYGKPQRFAYWDGGSAGGRQALELAQNFPNDFDGIIAAWPAVYFTQLAVASLYPQIVMQRDLGRNLSLAQIDLVSRAAVESCDVVNGQHLGFILHPEACRYDPGKDAAVLCRDAGGANATDACVSQREAIVFNKIWYGMTSDGSVPDPASDNGFGPLGGKHKWYGLSRGTNLLIVAAPQPFSIGADAVALTLQDPRLAQPTFLNARASGADGWKNLTYEQLSAAFDAGLAMQEPFADFNAGNPDLSAFRAQGGKLLLFHGTNDEAIPFQGSVRYYDSVVERMGGLAKVQDFFRFYVIPGYGHATTNGTSNRNANPPVPRPLKAEMYKAVTDWVEQGIKPGTITLRSADTSLSFTVRTRQNADGSNSHLPGVDAWQAATVKGLPACIYPRRIAYAGGNIFAAKSYACRSAQAAKKPLAGAQR
jgi:Tannase and feruloyl esterase